MKSINKKFDIGMKECSDFGMICIKPDINSTYYKLLLKIIKLVRFEFNNVKMNTSNYMLPKFIYYEYIYKCLSDNDIMLDSTIDIYKLNSIDIHGKSINILLMYLFPYTKQLFYDFNKFGNDISYYKSIKKLNELEYEKFEANKLTSINSINSLSINIICNNFFYDIIKNHEKYDK